MFRKLLITLVVFVTTGLIVCGAAATANPSVGLPRTIEPDSTCPVTGCASGLCHGFDNVPQPDGEHEMICPEVGCATVECHAWDTLETRYYRPSDGSLNLWIVAPVVLVGLLVLMVRKL
ncbi:MAG: hypothetical protein VB027_00865 [Gordonibacter sp.]|nr:hypothetical protein [Gordonibacter sp.]